MRRCLFGPATRTYNVTYAAVQAQPVKVYINPFDASAGGDIAIDGQAFSGYAANLQVFGQTCGG